MSFAPPFTAQSPITSLPNEVLTTVFKFFLFDDPDPSDVGEILLQIGSGLPPHFVLMSVCKHWMELCTSLRTLWTNLTINFLPAKRIPPPGSQVWNKFAVVCKKILERSNSLPLDLQLFNWPLNDDTIRGVSGMGLDEEVLSSEQLCYRILQLSIAQCTRWKSFLMDGFNQSSCTVPWAQLMEVAHRIPMLERIKLSHLQLPSLRQRDYTNLFLDAPSLSYANLAFHNVKMNLPWLQLKAIIIDSAGFESYRQFANYIGLMMARTTAPTICLYNTMTILKDTEGIGHTLPTIKNPHISTLRLPTYTILPPLCLPNLTTLSFEVRSGTDWYGVAPIERLLRDSNCRLLTLLVRERSIRAGFIVMAHLLPFCNALENLEFTTGAADKYSVNHIVAHASVLLANPIRLPKLLSLTVNIDNSFRAMNRPDPHHFYFDIRYGKAVWSIVERRMIEWPEVRLGRPKVVLKSFHVNIVLPRRPSGLEMMVASSWAWELLESEEWHNINEAGVDFKTYPPVG